MTTTPGRELLLVSGLGTSGNASDVGSNRHTLFAHSNPFQPGVMEIDFLNDGAVCLAVIECTSDQPDGFEVYSQLLEEPARWTAHALQRRESRND